MEHERYIEQMSAALDGELSPGERRELDSHLAQCPQCAALFDRLSRHAAALRRLECGAPPGLKDAIMDHLPPQMEVRKRAVIPWSRLGGLAACIALIGAAGLYAMILFTPAGSGAPPRDAGAVTADMSAPAEAQQNGTVEYSMDDAEAEEPQSCGAGEDSKGTYGVPGYTETDSSLQVYGHTVAAVLTLSALPEDTRAAWPEEEIIRLEGYCYYLTTGEVLDGLLQWAQGREDVTSSLTSGAYTPDDRCAVCWTE